MDEKRQGEIALALLKDRARREGIRFAGLKRELGNVAQRTGIPLAELEEFVRLTIGELVEESLGK